MPKTETQRKSSRPGGITAHLDSAARSLQGILCRRDAQHTYIVRVGKDRDDAARQVTAIGGQNKLRPVGNDPRPILNWNSTAFPGRSHDHRSQEAP